MKNKILLIIFLLLSSASTFALTEESRTTPGRPFFSSVVKPHIGLIVVYEDANSDDRADHSTSAGLGVDVGYQPSPPVGVGAELTSVDNHANILAKMTYNFSGENILIRNSFAGAAVGTTEDSGAVGPLIGFDIPLQGETTSKTVSLGADAKYLFLNHDNQVFSLNGVVKYWF
ncbi:MAG: hypothetical protein ACXWPX_12020 [Pseudobdellovibrio sp.]